MNHKIGRNMELGKNMEIGNNVVIEDDAVLGNNISLKDNVVIRKGVMIGDNVIIGYRDIKPGQDAPAKPIVTEIGESVRIRSGSVIYWGLSLIHISEPTRPY